MFRQFLQTKPLQAGKLVAILATLAYAVGVYVGLVPSESITTLFLVPLLALALALIVTAEMLYAGYRARRAAGTVTDRLNTHPRYTFVRAVEFGFAVVAVIAVTGLVISIPAGPMAGPGAVWVFFVLVGLGLLVLVGSLLRTLVEFYRYQTSGTV